MLEVLLTTQGCFAHLAITALKVVGFQLRVLLDLLDQIRVDNNKDPLYIVLQDSSPLPLVTAVLLATTVQLSRLLYQRFVPEASIALLAHLSPSFVLQGTIAQVEQERQ
jgi:hypothetical protein